MTENQDAQHRPGAPATLPAELAGQWIAWNRDMTEVIAHGSSLSEVRQEASRNSEAEPVFQKAPKAVSFIG